MRLCTSVSSWRRSRHRCSGLTLYAPPVFAANDEAFREISATLGLSLNRLFHIPSHCPVVTSTGDALVIGTERHALNSQSVSCHWGDISSGVRIPHHHRGVGATTDPVIPFGLEATLLALLECSLRVEGFYSPTASHIFSSEMDLRFVESYPPPTVTIRVPLGWKATP